MGVVLKVRLPFRLGFARTATAEPAADVRDAGLSMPPLAVPDAPLLPVDVAPVPPPEAIGALPPAPPPVDDSAALLWLAYTSALASRAMTLEDAAVAALEGRLDAGPRRRAARETHKLATSLWLVEAREAARLAWEAAGLLDAGTLLGTANALRLSQIVETLHTTVRALPPPEALSPAGRPTAPYLHVVDDDEGLARELPIEAAVRGWRARVVPHLNDAVDDTPTVIVLGPDVLGDTDAAARGRLLAAFPEAAVATLSAGATLADRTAAHGVVSARTIAKPTAPAALVDDAVALLRRRQAAAPTIVVATGDARLGAQLRQAVAGLGTLIEVHEAGEALWSVVTEVRPDLCVIDDAAGPPALDVVRALRRDWDVAPTSVLLLVASIDETSMARVAEAGVDDWLPRSAAPSLVTAVARNRLARSTTQRLAADLDPATRLPHLRSAVPSIERMVAIARRYNHPLAMLVVEVDGRRGAADDDGTAEGLSSLLGRRLARAFRAEDLVTQAAPGRYVVAAFGMKSDDGVQRLAEMLEHFREQVVERRGLPSAPASFSAGVAQIRVDGADAAALIRAAEGALQLARQQGGNRIETVSRSEASRVEWTADAVVIDADAPFAALVEHALETRGHRVRTVHDGREALDLLTHPQTPLRARLIVLELGLPGLDGLTLLGQLAEAGVLKSSRAVVVTTRSVEAEMIKAMELGAIDYITKPVSLPVLMRRLRSTLAGGTGVA